MRPLYIFFSSIIIIAIFMMIGTIFVRADELEDINKKLSDLQQSLDSSQKATANNEQQLANLNTQLNSIKNQVAKIEKDITQKTEDIEAGEKRLVKQKKLLDERIVSFYKNKGREKDALLHILLSDNLPLFLKQFTYQQNLLDDDRKTIVRIVMLVKDIEDKKTVLEDEMARLEPIKEAIDKQSKFLEGEVLSAKQYQQTLKNEIATLSAKQQQIIAQKQASLNIPRSAGSSARGCSDDRGVNPGFSPRIAFFTYGAPHRNGLNQYGAWGRAKAGQNEEQILQAYYPNFSLKKDYDQNTQVNVEGYGSFSIEDYVKRIYEVPDSWTDNNLATLKAQAVAARSYALNTMQRRGSICTTEACQVFKPEPKGGNWEQAVTATAGWVLMDGGSPAFTQYASTHGGYILNLNKFDGRDGNPGSFGELNERAYDKDSPWFYCDWGARADYNKTAWLKSEEVADIANVILLAQRDSSVGEHLYQPDKSNPGGTDTWSPDKVRSELKNRGGNPYTAVLDISVGVDFGSGKTTSVNVTGDAGTQSFSAPEWKDWFNLRAPANIQIVGPLFNIEKQ